MVSTHKIPSPVDWWWRLARRVARWPACGGGDFVENVIWNHWWQLEPVDVVVDPDDCDFDVHCQSDAWVRGEIRPSGQLL